MPPAVVTLQTIGTAGEAAVAMGQEAARHLVAQMAGTLLALAEEVEPERFRGPQAVGPQCLPGRLADPQVPSRQASMGRGVAPGWCSVWTPARGATTES